MVLGYRFFFSLNYSDMDYAKIILKEGKKIFRSRFDVIAIFLSLSEYNCIM